MISRAILKILTRKPWVADMRDPWTTEELRYGSKNWRLAIDKYSERLLLRNADIVIGVTPGWLDDLKQLAGEVEKDGKFELITNGYDESDFAGYPLPDLNSKNEIMMSHVGNMFEGGLEPLISGIQNLNGSLMDRLRVELIGYVHPSDQDRLANSPAQKTFICQSQKISHIESLEKMRASHVLLLSLPLEYYPGKVFEYMRVGRPVLAIVPDGSVLNLIKRAQIGLVFLRDDEEGLTEAINQIVDDYDGFVKQNYRPDWNFIRQFERKTLSKKLSSILDRISIN